MQLSLDSPASMDPKQVMLVQGGNPAAGVLSGDSTKKGGSRVSQR